MCPHLTAAENMFLGREINEKFPPLEFNKNAGQIRRFCIEFRNKPVESLSKKSAVGVHGIVDGDGFSVHDQLTGVDLEYLLALLAVNTGELLIDLTAQEHVFRSGQMGTHIQLLVDTSNTEGLHRFLPTGDLHNLTPICITNITHFTTKSTIFTVKFVRFVYFQKILLSFNNLQGLFVRILGQNRLSLGHSFV